MNNKAFIFSIGSIFCIIIISGFVSSNAFTILTNNGTMTVTNGNLGFIGGNLITKINGSNINFFDNRFVTGTLQQVNWNQKDQNNYLSAQMELNSKYADNVRNSQPFPGKITTVCITPITNTLDAPITITLLINGISTGKTITISNNTLFGTVAVINQSFNLGDSLTWVISGQSQNHNGLLFNGQVLISYIG